MGVELVVNTQSYINLYTHISLRPAFAMIPS